MLKFDASIFGGELPVGLGVVGIAVVLPGGDFVDEDLFVGNTAIEALVKAFGKGINHPDCCFSPDVVVYPCRQEACLLTVLASNIGHRKGRIVVDAAFSILLAPVLTQPEREAGAFLTHATSGTNSP